jgi:hypothetical protein
MASPVLVKTCAEGKQHQEMCAVGSFKARDIYLGSFLNIITIKWLVSSSWEKKMY